MVSLSKGDASRGAQESGPVPGSVLQLDGALSTPGTGSHPMELSYRWVQVSGPTVALSSPFSSVTTFVVPELDDGRPRQYAFQLFVDDAATGDLRSAPAPAVFEVAGTERTVSIPLVQGANLIGLPVDPGPNGRPSDVRQLAEMTGASLVLYEAPSAQQPGWRVYDPLLAPYSPAIAGNRAYLLLIPRVPTGPLQLTGGAWPPSAAGPLELKRGMGLVSLPGSPATSSRLHDILRALGASVLVVSEPSPGGCRFRALTGTGPFEGDRTPVEGEGLLYWRCGGGTATLNHLLQ
jgi:hypothetical protein